MSVCVMGGDTRDARKQEMSVLGGIMEQEANKD